MRFEMPSNQENPLEKLKSRMSDILGKNEEKIIKGFGEVAED